MKLRELFNKQLTEATLRRGSRGEEVKVLQRALNIEDDGIFGPNTEAAVRAFQQRAGIQVDGIAGGQTQAALSAGGAPRNAGPGRAAGDWEDPPEGTAPTDNTTTQRPDDGSAEPAAEPAVEPEPAAEPAAEPTGSGRGDGEAEVDTTAPAQPAAPAAGDDDQLARQATDDERAFQAANGISTPQQPDAAPSVDTTAATAQQISRFQQAYGNGTDGQLPTLFRDRFLNPVLDNLGSESMQALSDELAGEIPQAPARIVVQRLEQVYGNEQELEAAAEEMRSDTDPEIQDQVRALDLLIPLLRKLKQDAARNESIDLDRIKMLAGV